MGNILKQDIKEMTKQNFPTVDELNGCNKCKVKYICGGGCFANSYKIKKMRTERNRWICPYEYHLAEERLLTLKNRPLKNA